MLLLIYIIVFGFFAWLILVTLPEPYNLPAMLLFIVLMAAHWVNEQRACKEIAKDLAEQIAQDGLPPEWEQ